MPLLIQQTGLEEYAPGGAARVKVLNIGGPGAGKTRWASYFPKPIYADCERGLASVADRRVPFVNIATSQDMLDLLALLKQECRQPAENRKYQTIVIDTLDAFQRKIKNEWLEKERKEVFTGWEAWGYLNSRMQLLMTRLLNLDMNVIVNVHYKDKKTKDDETGKESHELMLQLQGDLADTAFNDFDLVGWMGTYWEAVEGQRVQKRGLTFRASPDKPFLKDRLNVTPNWLEVQFADSDYQDLFARIQAKVGELDDSAVIGEVPSEVTVPGSFVIPPGAAGGGAMPVTELPAGMGYQHMDKPTLLAKMRERGITTTTDGGPIKGNTLKAELIAALEAADAPPAAPAAPAPQPATGDKPETPPASPPPAKPVEPAPEKAGSDAPRQALKRIANAQRTQLKTVAEGTVDTATGELVTDPAASVTSKEAAVALVEDQLGGQVIAETEDPPASAPAADPPKPAGPAAPAAASSTAGMVCDECGKSLDGDDPDVVKLSWIKFRKRLCAADYAGRKAGSR